MKYTFYGSHDQYEDILDDLREDGFDEDTAHETALEMMREMETDMPDVLDTEGGPEENPFWEPLDYGPEDELEEEDKLWHDAPNSWNAELGHFTTCCIR